MGIAHQATVVYPDATVQSIFFYNIAFSFHVGPALKLPAALVQSCESVGERGASSERFVGLLFINHSLKQRTGLINLYGRRRHQLALF